MWLICSILDDIDPKLPLSISIFSVFKDSESFSDFYDLLLSSGSRLICLL